MANEFPAIFIFYLYVLSYVLTLSYVIFILCLFFIIIIYFKTIEDYWITDYSNHELCYIHLSLLEKNAIIIKNQTCASLCSTTTKRNIKKYLEIKSFNNA